MSVGIEVSRAMAADIADIERAAFSLKNNSIGNENESYWRVDSSGRRADRLTEALLRVGAHPLFPRIVLAESSFSAWPWMKPGDEATHLDYYFGISADRTRLGICDPETRLRTQQQVVKDLYPILKARAIHAPERTSLAPHQLTLAELDILTEDLGIPAEQLNPKFDSPYRDLL